MSIIQSPEALIVLIFLAGLLCGGLLGVTLTLRRSQQRLTDERQARGEALQRLARLEAQLEAEKNSTLEKLDLLEEIRQRSEKNFQHLSSQALAANNRNFLDLAKATLEQHQGQARQELEQRQSAIDQLVQPLKEALTQVNGKIAQLEQARSGAYARLDEQVKSLLGSQLKLEEETGNLVKALRTPTVRGRWGEIQLRKVVEMAGMLDYCDFVEQESSADGRARPDMIVRLPNSRNIVIDAKAPLMAYLEAIEANDEKTQAQAMNHHARHIRNHIIKLSGKQYWDQFQPTPEFVVLFLPGESFFSAALSVDPALIEAGVERKVLLATPTTLIALLRSVAYGWREDKLTANALAISRLGQEIHERLATMHQHFEQMGKSLDKAVDSYNKGMASLDSRVLVTARKFTELGAASSKEINGAIAVEKRTRTPLMAEEDEEYQPESPGTSPENGD
ncbi:DNA recombination protein RmuC [Pelovirga terrestris]|uniref:DNA recombination protein RmuC n=1 Tax=Pelovirga terrestris TaxID=2771352 RepID=UPI0030802299